MKFAYGFLTAIEVTFLGEDVFGIYLPSIGEEFIPGFAVAIVTFSGEAVYGIDSPCIDAQLISGGSFMTFFSDEFLVIDPSSNGEQTIP